MPINYGTLAAGLGSGVNNIANAYSNIPNRIAQAKLRGAQQAKIDADMQDRIASQQALAGIAKNLGYDPSYFGGASTADEGLARLRLNAGVRAYGAAGMLNPVQQVIQAVTNTSPSVSENASVTPPISQLALKGNSYQQAPEPDNEIVRSQVQNNVMRDANLLRQIIQDTGAIENALKGNGMYKSTPNGGYFNSFYGDGGVYDDSLRAIWQNDKESQIANRQARLNLSQEREARIRSNGGRRGGGHRGGHRGGGHRGGSGGSSRGGVAENVRGAGGGGSPAPQNNGRPAGWTAQDEAALQRGDERYFDVDKEDF